jgi:hypothetical protein
LIKGGYITKKVLDFYVNYLNEKNKTLGLNEGVFIFDLGKELIQENGAPKRFEPYIKSIRQRLGAKIEFRSLSKVLFLIEKEASKYCLLELLRINGGGLTSIH